jgi:chaperonin GroES
LTALQKRLLSAALALALGECQNRCRGPGLSPLGPRFYSEVTTVMKIRPLADRIVVKRLEQETKTKGGIIIPDTAKEKPIEGMVVATGNGKVLKNGKLRALDVKAGDKILFGKYSGTEVKLDGVEHVILNEDDVLAIL